MPDLPVLPRPRSARPPLVLGGAIVAGALLLAVVGGLLVARTADDPVSSGAVAELVPADEPNPLLTPTPQGDAVPEGAFPRLDGGDGRFADYAGRPLVVNFFAQWCEPCIREMPEFEQVHRRLGGEVAFLGLDVRDPADAGRAIVADTGVTYDVGRDPSGALLEHFGGVAMPTTAFVDADGRIVDVVSRALSAHDLQQRIADAFGLEAAG